MSEKAIVDATVRLLDRRAVVHFNIAAGNGETGLPDRLAIHRGRAIFMEFKALRGQVTPKQQWWLDRLRQAGALALVVRSADDVELLLDAVDELAGPHREAMT